VCCRVLQYVAVFYLFQKRPLRRPRSLKMSTICSPRVVAACVAVCCSVLQQCVAVCCSVLPVLKTTPPEAPIFEDTTPCSPSVAAVCVAVYCRVLQSVAVCCRMLQCVAVCCSVLQCIIMCCLFFADDYSMFHETCCTVMQSVAVCCSLLQCVAVCCSVLQRVAQIYVCVPLANSSAPYIYLTNSMSLLLRLPTYLFPAPPPPLSPPS